MCKALQDLYDEGVERGVERGIECGRNQERKEIIIRLHEEGFFPERIARIAKVSIDTVQAVIEELLCQG